MMGQNGHDFRNQSDKLPQKHVFIFQIQFDPLKVVVSVISTHIIQGKVKIWSKFQKYVRTNFAVSIMKYIFHW